MEESSQALERFLAGVERRAFRMTHIATGSIEEALDIVQDTMLSLVQKYGAKPEKEWKVLFFRILQNRIRDWYRRESVRKRFRVWPTLGWNSNEEDRLEDPFERFVDPSGRDPAHDMMIGDSVHALDAALRSLPLRQQQAFFLRVWEGLNVSDTASVMKCSEGSVKTHYSRAIHALQNKLKDLWP
jgi:RNA polymerase sigma-70 factor (ECF subfamily)